MLMCNNAAFMIKFHPDIKLISLSPDIHSWLYHYSWVMNSANQICALFKFSKSHTFGSNLFTFYFNAIKVSVGWGCFNPSSTYNILTSQIITYATRRRIVWMRKYRRFHFCWLFLLSFVFACSAIAAMSASNLPESQRFEKNVTKRVARQQEEWNFYQVK